LQNRLGHVTGAVANGAEIGRIDGEAIESELNFRWLLGELQGRDSLHFDGTTYEGTVGLGDSTNGVAWNLSPAPLPN
jgi:hypothetical protein